MIDRRHLENFDWALLGIVLVLSFIGVMTIFSATRPMLSAHHQSFYLKQLYWIVVSLVCFLLVVSIDYRKFITQSYGFFILGIILLIVVLVAGKKTMGATRWISLGFISFQPSEFFKIFFILALSRYLSRIEVISFGLKELLKILLLFLLVPSILVLRQPDLGTVALLSLILLSLVLMAGLKKKIIVVTIIVGLIALPFVGNIFWGELKEYQRQRITAFFDPYVDTRGVGYHIHQSKVSVGSGRVFGKGYLQGTQAPLRFLPERHTDFIFSVFAEEWGFAGCFVLFIIYLIIFLRGLDTAHKASDSAGCYIALGITFMFVFYFIINVGMTLGMVPVVGAPLPFMSYGGTALLTNFIGIGLLINVRMRRFTLFY